MRAAGPSGALHNCGMSLRVLGGLTATGLGVGAAWGFFGGGVVLGLFGGLWCAVFSICDASGAVESTFLFALIGLVLGAATGLVVGLLAGVLTFLELAFAPNLIESPSFPLVAGAQVGVPCLVFLPPDWFFLSTDGAAFALELIVLKLVPAFLAGFVTYRYLLKEQSGGLSVS